MKKINLIVVAFCVLGFISCQNSNTNVIENNSVSVTSVLDIEQKVAALLKQMTLEEKIGQMNQYNGFWNVTGPVPEGGDAQVKYKFGSYSLVLKRKLNDIEEKIDTQFQAGKSIPIAFNIWDGYQGETESKKSISSWFELQLVK